MAECTEPRLPYQECYDAITGQTTPTNKLDPSYWVYLSLCLRKMQPAVGVGSGGSEHTAVGYSRISCQLDQASRDLRIDVEECLLRR